MREKDPQDREKMRDVHIFEVGEFYHHGTVHLGNQETDEK